MQTEFQIAAIMMASVKTNLNINWTETGRPSLEIFEYYHLQYLLYYRILTSICSEVVLKFGVTPPQRSHKVFIKKKNGPHLKLLLNKKCHAL